MAAIPQPILNKIAYNAESLLFEQFIRKRISSVYRACNRFWKRKIELLQKENDRLKKDLFDSLNPNSDSITQDTQFKSPEIPQNVIIETQLEILDNDDVTQEIPNEFKVIEPNLINMEQSENLTILSNSNSRTTEKEDSDTESVDLELKEQPTTVIKILKVDRKKKTAVVRSTKGKVSKTLYIDYSSEEEIEEIALGLSNLAHSNLNLFETIPKKRKNPKTKRQKFKRKKK
jgi:hypothetical protein